MRPILILGLALGIGAPSIATARAEPWILWSRDTRFEARQPARLWQTAEWIARGGPFHDLGDCQRRLADEIGSAAETLADGYHITARLETSVVARQRDGSGGVRRRYMCLPVSVAPPK